MPCSEYDALAVDYEWLFSDATLAGDRRSESLAQALAALPPNAAVLDCACGTGVTASGLARDGLRVTGSDASAEMIAQARRRTTDAGRDIRLEICAWDALPEVFGAEFDLVLCGGNSIGHCRDEAEMLGALRGMRAVIRPGGRLLVDSRNWELILRDRVRFTSFRRRHRRGTSCLPIYVWTFPDGPNDPLTVEVLFVLEEPTGVTLRHCPITYRPFRCNELLARLDAAGFVDVESDYEPERARYNVHARVPG